MLNGWFGCLGFIIAMLVVVYACLKTLKASPSHNFVVVWLQLIAYYSRFWVMWVFVWANAQIIIDNHAFYWLISILALLYLYISWIEPNRLRIRYQTIDFKQNNIKQNDIKQNNIKQNINNPTKHPIKLAVVGDMHFGIFYHKAQLQRLVSQLNRLDVDAVLFTGDWLYHAGADVIGQMMIIKAINKPCYTTFSQADLTNQHEKSDFVPNLRLNEILPILGVKIIDNQTVNIGGVDVIGVGANLGASVGVQVAKILENNHKNQKISIILTHDVKNLQAHAQILANLRSNTLILAGQTHGGQVNVPVLTKKMVQAMTGSQYLSGYYTHISPQHKNANNNSNQNNHYQVWINTGLGMVGLPFRLNCPPQIDVLTIHYS